MIFEEGQIITRNGIEYCVLDTIDYANKTYVLFASQSDKIGFSFFEVQRIKDLFNLFEVTDDNLNNILMSLYEAKNYGDK